MNPRHVGTKLKCIIHCNIQAQTLKPQEERVGENLYNLGIVRDFLSKTQSKPQEENVNN